MHHNLKIHPEYFEEVFCGKKNFEIRKNDRHFNAGDLVLLLEFCPQQNKYTGRSIGASIGYVTQFNQKDDFVVFSLLDLVL